MGLDLVLVAAILLVLVGMTGLIVELYYLEDVARRMQDAKTCGHVIFIRPALLATLGILILCVGGSIVCDQLDPYPGKLSGVWCFVLVDLLSLAVFGMSYLIMLASFAGKLGAYLEAIQLRESKRGKAEPGGG